MYEVFMALTRVNESWRLDIWRNLDGKHSYISMRLSDRKFQFRFKRFDER